MAEQTTFHCPGCNEHVPVSRGCADALGDYCDDCAMMFRDELAEYYHTEEELAQLIKLISQSIEGNLTLKEKMMLVNATKSAGEFRKLLLQQPSSVRQIPQPGVRVRQHFPMPTHVPMPDMGVRTGHWGAEGVVEVHLNEPPPSAAARMKADADQIREKYAKMSLDQLRLEKEDIMEALGTSLGEPRRTELNMELKLVCSAIASADREDQGKKRDKEIETTARGAKLKLSTQVRTSSSKDLEIQVVLPGWVREQNEDLALAMRMDLIQKHGVDAVRGPEQELHRYAAQIFGIHYDGVVDVQKGKIELRQLARCAPKPKEPEPVESFNLRAVIRYEFTGRLNLYMETEPAGDDVHEHHWYMVDKTNADRRVPIHHELAMALIGTGLDCTYSALEEVDNED